MSNSAEWVTSFEAVEILRKAGIESPATLGQWAEVGHVRAQTKSSLINGKPEEFSGFPDIPAVFWSYQVGTPKVPPNWIAGHFEADMIRQEDGGYERKLRVVLSNVTFHADDLHRQIKAATGGRAPHLPPPRNSRNAGRRVNKDLWGKTAAAMAVLSARGRLSADSLGNSEMHKLLSDFLAELGEDEAFSVDHMKDTFTYYRAWSTANEWGGDD
jgi:hypothetical protein